MRQDYSYSNILIYNNTFYNLNDGGVHDLTGQTGNACTGCQAMDNLGVQTGFGSFSGWNASSNNTGLQDKPVRQCGFTLLDESATDCAAGRYVSRRHLQHGYGCEDARSGGSWIGSV